MIIPEPLVALLGVLGWVGFVQSIEGIQLNFDLLKLFSLDSRMIDPSSLKSQSFRDSKGLAEWLERHHAAEDELWIKIYKRKSKVPSVSWGEVVVETLRWGWIDGVKKSLDEHAYLQRITPRRAKSAWSKRNTEHVERLIKEGRMKEPGLRQVEAAKADGRWESAYLPASELEVPEDFVKAVEKEKKVKEFYDSLTKSSRYAIAYGLTTAKRAETRARRFGKFIEMLRRGEKPGFGFK